MHELSFEAVNDRLPPQNVEAEESILGGILLDPEAIGRVADVLQPDVFYLAAHQEIYRATLALHNQGSPTDLMCVLAWLQDQGLLTKVGGQNKLTQLVDRTVSAVNIDQYATLIKEKYLRRQLIKAANEISQRAYETSLPLDAVLDQAEQKIFSVTQDRIQQGLVPTEEILARTFADLEQRSLGNVLPGLSCNFYDLDAMTQGFQRSDLIIVAGRPAMGKTALSLQIAKRIAEIHKAGVAVYSLEMSKEQLVQRLLASESRIDSNYLRAGRINQNQWEPLSRAIGTLSQVPLYIDDTPNPSLGEIRSNARRLQAERPEGLGLILIDYLQLMGGGDAQDGRVQELSKITRALKGLARELHVPIIALSQLSRGVESRTNKRPLMSDLRESGCLTGDSLITLADTGAQVPLRELIGQSGFAVWGLNPSTMKLERAEVSHAFATGTKPILKLQTRLGRVVRATGNHKFLTISGWKRLDELQPGDRLALPRQIPNSDLQLMSDAELALLGHLIGDGCTLPRHSIQYTTRELDLAETVKNLAEDVFGEAIQPRINREKAWYQVYLTASQNLGPGLKNPITKWLENLQVFGLRSHEKFVPADVFAQPQSAIAVFLRHLWSTDGCIQPAKDRRYPAVYYASSSQRLAKDVQTLLLRFEINARLRISPQPNKGKPQHQVWVTGKPDLEKFAQEIGAVGDYKVSSLEQIAADLESVQANTNRDVIPKDVWRSLVVPAMEKIGMTSRQMQAALGNQYCGTSLYKNNLSRERAVNLGEIVQSQEILNLAHSDIYWDEIVTIEPDGVEEVFDLTIPGIHNFVANNIIVHNSIEQDADLIILLYRDEYYNPDTPDRGVCELILAKHRNGPVGTVKLLFDPQYTRFENLAQSR
jgi:replicative DNA helicase